MDKRKQKEGRGGMKEKGPEIILFWGKEEGEVGRRFNSNSPPSLY
jgi:hypothetical protein